MEIEYLSPEQTQRTALGKLSAVDVRCIENNGQVFVVEMQSEWSNLFRKRLLPIRKYLCLARSTR